MTKLEKLLTQVAAEKAAIAKKAAAEKAAAKIAEAKQKQKQVAAAAALIVKCNLAGVSHDLLLPRLQKIAADFATEANRG